jgi:hypothetical protein
MNPFKITVSVKEKKKRFSRVFSLSWGEGSKAGGSDKINNCASFFTLFV